MAHENTPERAPSRGSTVVYVAGTRAGGRDRFRIAEVIGPALDDPATGRIWLGVLLPELPGMVDMIDFSCVVNVVPPP